ncbi:FeoB-associated Cys-rich membrane protein [Peptoniphilus sp.]|jgi:hypothetical protein|uniref:FeoB-associated Cys-rich membrane protein n=1 Tax=Peptoniphilus sp. TaxID=1971214 RepID=UPI003D93C835
MKIIDVILALIIAAVLALAFKKTRKTKGCSCGCNGCNTPCSAKDLNNAGNGN